MRIIAGTARGRKIEAPSGKNTRPTLDRVRENLFNILQVRIRSSRILDLFAGSGALSLEALSRGAEYAVMVDHDRNACRIQRANTEKLGFMDRTEFFCCDWRQALRELRRKSCRFDLIFLDPPYVMTDLRIMFDDLTPFLASDGLIVLEHEAGKAIDTGNCFVKTDERKWGFCAVSFFEHPAVK